MSSKILASGRSALDSCKLTRKIFLRHWRQKANLVLYVTFSISFGVIGAYAQMKFTDEMKGNSKYWQSFHAPKKH